MTSLISRQVAQLLRNGQADAAISLAQRRASADQSAEAHAALAHAYLFVGNPAAALEAASSALELSPDEPALLFLRARIQYILGNREASLEDCGHAIRQSAELDTHYYTESLYLLAAANFNALDRSEQARQCLTHVSEACSVMAGQLLTRDGVAKLAQEPAVRSRRPSRFGHSR